MLAPTMAPVGMDEPGELGGCAGGEVLVVAGLVVVEGAAVFGTVTSDVTVTGFVKTLCPGNNSQWETPSHGRGAAPSVEVYRYSDAVSRRVLEPYTGKYVSPEPSVQ